MTIKALKKNTRTDHDRAASRKRRPVEGAPMASFARSVAIDQDRTRNKGQCTRCDARWRIVELPYEGGVEYTEQLTHADGCSLQRDISKLDGLGYDFATY